MKVQVNLFLKEDNSFNGIYDGTPVDIAAMFHKIATDSNEMKSALLIATSAVFSDHQRPDLKDAAQRLVILINQ